MPAALRLLACSLLLALAGAAGAARAAARPPSAGPPAGLWRAWQASAGWAPQRALQQAPGCAILGCRDCRGTAGGRATCASCHATFFRTAPDATGVTRCYCPPGTVAASRAGSAPSCADAGQGFWSPGGARTATSNAEAAGRRVRCADGLVTTVARASSPRQCLVPAGSFWNASARSVQACARGSFRGGQLPRDDPAALACSRCPEGVTTRGTGAASAAGCLVLKPGYFAKTTAPKAAFLAALGRGGSSAGASGGSARRLAMAATAADQQLVIVEAWQCPWGSFSQGGTLDEASCQPCPHGYATPRNGSTSEDECMAPPGWFTDGSQLLECGPGFYRAGWAATHLSGALTMEAACSSCGAGLSSDACEWDRRFNGTQTSEDHHVSGSATCCYIEPGYGSSVTEAGALQAYPCPPDSYGSLQRTRGLQPAPCTPCPNATTTRGAAGSTDEFACTGHPAGWGLLDGEMRPCTQGSFNPADTVDFQPCQACGLGRTTTAGDPAAQASAADCFPVPGHGLALNASGDAAALQLGLPQLQAEAAARGVGLLQALAALPVVPCPVGAFAAPAPWLDAARQALGNASSGDAAALARLAVLCAPCGGDRLTDAPGATSEAQCTRCPPGYEPLGEDASAPSACRACPLNSFQAFAGEACVPCDEQVFMLNFDGTLMVPGVTLAPASAAADLCFPRAFSPLPDLPQAVLASGEAADWRPAPEPGAGAGFEACAASCAAGSVCVASLVPAAGGGNGSCVVASYAPRVGGDVLLRDAPRFTLSVKLPSPGGADAGAASLGFVRAATSHAWAAAPATPGLAPLALPPPPPGGAAVQPLAAALQACDAACAAAGRACAAHVFDSGARACAFVDVTQDEAWFERYTGVVVG